MRSRYPAGSRLFLAGIALLSVVCLLIAVLPFPALDHYLSREYSVELLDRRGNFLYVSPLDEGMRRQYRRLDEIPADVRRIFILAEDQRFYLHFGTDPIALLRSMYRLIRYDDSASGASTITMQLARMVLDGAGPRRGGRLVRKIEEIITAFKIETRLGKERILELWLNGIPFGNQIEGVAAAATHFFGADLHSLTVPQLLSLALIPRNPTGYSPIDEPVRVLTGAERLSATMGISLDMKTALTEIGAADWGRWPDEAPHFSRALLPAVADRRTGGRISTTLDPDLQEVAVNLLQIHLDRSVESRIENGAVLVVENSTGSIRAYAGSQDFSSPAGGQIDGVQIKNQPGSTIKPFLYAYAIEQGYGPNDLLADIPTDFGRGEVYVPRNFDREYHGQVRFRTALASSLNIPAASLLQLLGVRNFASFLQDIGFESVGDDSRNGTPESGLGMALGNTPVTLYELVRGFSIFPRGGVYRDLRWSSEGDTRGAGGRGVRVMSESTAWMIYDMLSDPPERVTGFGMEDPFWLGPGTAAGSVAVKTGTSSRGANIWALAASGEYTVGVWMGNFAGDTVIGRTGSSVPARVALEILEFAGRTGGTRSLNPPHGLGKTMICSLTGMAAAALCPATRQEYFTGEAPPECTLHGEHFDGQLNPFYPADRSQTQLLEIRSPIEGAVYYFDNRLPNGIQAIRVEVSHAVDSKPALTVDGKPEARAPLEESGGLTSWIVELRPGPMTLAVASGGERATRVVEVR